MQVLEIFIVESNELIMNAPLADFGDVLDRLPCSERYSYHVVDTTYREGKTEYPILAEFHERDQVERYIARIDGNAEGIAMKNNMKKELYLFMWKTGFIWLTKHYCGGVILLGTLISGLAIYFDGAWWVPIVITLVFLSVNALFAAVLPIISRDWRSQGIETYNNSATPER